MKTLIGIAKEDFNNYINSPKKIMGSLCISLLVYVFIEIL